MALSGSLTGTIKDLQQIFGFDKTMEMIHVDPYKRCMVPDDEEFTITVESMKEARIISQE